MSEHTPRLHSDKLPLPWFVDDAGSEKSFRVFSGDPKGAYLLDWQEVAMCYAEIDDGVSLQTAQANAEFIVRACNVHDELVAALEAINSDLPSARRYSVIGAPTPIETIDAMLSNARRALAKAKGGPS